MNVSAKSFFTAIAQTTGGLYFPSPSLQDLLQMLISISFREANLPIPESNLNSALQGVLENVQDKYQ